MLDALVSLGEKINQTTYPRMSTLVIYLEPKTGKIVLNLLLERTTTDNEKEFPDASRIVKRNFYMNDFLYSAKSNQEAVFLERNLISLLQKGGFKLSKCQSNVHEVCEKESDYLDRLKVPKLGYLLNTEV